MARAAAPFLLADIVLPTSVVFVAVPLAAAFGVWWLISRTDRIVHSIFPHLAWEHSLGWLNITAERRANTAFRWIRRGLYLLLFDALAVMLWTAHGFPSLQGSSDDWLLGELAWRVPLLLLCFAIWVLYLGCGLLPRIRAQREMEALRQFRAEMEEIEQQREAASPKARVHAALAKPRKNVPLASGVSPRLRRFDQPGG